MPRATGIAPTNPPNRTKGPPGRGSTLTCIARKATHPTQATGTSVPTNSAADLARAGMARHHRGVAELESHSCHRGLRGLCRNRRKDCCGEQTGRKLMNLAQHEAVGAVLGVQLAPPLHNFYLLSSPCVLKSDSRQVAPTLSHTNGTQLQVSIHRFRNRIHRRLSPQRRQLAGGISRDAVLQRTRYRRRRHLLRSQRTPGCHRSSLFLRGPVSLGFSRRSPQSATHSRPIRPAWNSMFYGWSPTGSQTSMRSVRCIWRAGSSKILTPQSIGQVTDCIPRVGSPPAGRTQPKRIHRLNPDLSHVPPEHRWPLLLASLPSPASRQPVARISCPRQRAWHSHSRRCPETWSRSLPSSDLPAGPCEFFDEARASILQKHLNPIFDSVLEGSALFAPELAMLDRESEADERDLRRARASIVYNLPQSEGPSPNFIKRPNDVAPLHGKHCDARR